jgi:hypothetical protein
MPGGLLPLVAYGNMNRMVSGNPQMSYFYKAFIRYSHFSTESITVPLEGPNQLNLDEQIQLRVKVPRHGDLLSDVFLTLDMPAIYNKVWNGRISHEFSWVRQLGIRMIDTIGLYIGGSKVQEFSSEWLAMKYQLDQNIDSFEKWSNLIGDVPEMFAPASGAYADPQGGYPNVLPFNGQKTQFNAPSIPARQLNIPLGLFFSDAPGLALPLIGLQYHDVEIRILMRPIREIYTVLDPNGERTQYGYTLSTAQGTTIYATSWNSAWGPLPNSLNNNYLSYTDISGAPRYFFTDVGYSIPGNDGWNLNPRLQCTYVYLTDNERKLFATKKLEYIVRQIQEFNFEGINSRQQLELDAHSLVTRVVWFAQRSDWYYRNDYTNFLNWKYTDPEKRPYAKTPNNANSSSGVLIPGSNRYILNTARILCGGNEIFEEKDASYFSDMVPYRTCVGDSYQNLINGVVAPLSAYPIYVYSFALNSSNNIQPSGTINTSRINLVNLEVNPFPIPIDANYTYNFNIYVESLNWVEIASGSGGMKFSI